MKQHRSKHIWFGMLAFVVALAAFWAMAQHGAIGTVVAQQGLQPEQYLPVIASGNSAPAPTPTPSPTPSPTPPPNPNLNVNQFSVWSQEINSGTENITIQWNTSGASSVTIRLVAPLGVSPLYPHEWQVAASGSMTVPDPYAMMAFVSAEITLSDGNSQYTESKRLNLHCMDDFFFGQPSTTPNWCPAMAHTETGSYLQFERGVMFWHRRLDGSGEIWVFTNTFNNQSGLPQYMYSDTWVPADGVIDPSYQPPAGLFQPAYGFGKVWRENADLRNQLGWATGSETIYQRTLQTVQTDLYETHLYLSLPNSNQVFRLTTGLYPMHLAWETFNP